MSLRPASLAVPLLVGALLTGCASDPRADLRSLVEDITLEANDRDAAGVRSGVERLLSAVDRAVREGAISDAEAAVLRDRALAVQAGADEIDDNVLARREAERQAQEARERLEAERQAAAEAERLRQEEERRRAEQAARQAEEAAQQAERDAAEAEEKEQKDKDKDEDDDDDRADRSRGQGRG
jgi:hypothetical protein